MIKSVAVVEGERKAWKASYHRAYYAAKGVAYHQAYRAANAKKIAAYQKVYRRENKEALAISTSLWYLENKGRHRENTRAWYSANKVTVAEATKRWRQENPTRVAIYAQDWRSRNPQKSRAHRIVRVAVKNGKLKKQPCVECGKEKAEAHHEDYSKPLKVIWLCRQCHVDLHAAEKAGGLLALGWSLRPNLAQELRREL